MKENVNRGQNEAAEISATSEKQPRLPQLVSVQNPEEIPLVKSLRLTSRVCSDWISISCSKGPSLLDISDISCILLFPHGTLVPTNHFLRLEINLFVDMLKENCHVLARESFVLIFFIDILILHL